MTLRQEVQAALGEVYSGAGPDETMSLLTKLFDRGVIVAFLGEVRLIDGADDPLDGDDYGEDEGAVM